MTPNFFIFLAQTVAESVQRSCSFLCSFPLCHKCFYQAIFSSFFSSEERKGEEECEAPWCSLVCWMCLADVKSCHLFPFWAIFGTLVLTRDHRHYKKKAHDSLSWTEFPAFAISVSFEAAIKPSSLYLILQTLDLEIWHADIKIVIRFSFFFNWSEVLISVFGGTSVCARPWI